MGWQIRSSMLLAVFAAAATSAGDQADWPQFRGANAQGVAATAKLPLRWNTRENVVWTADIPGKGWGSPVVWGDKIIVASAVGVKPADVPRKGLYAQNLQGRPGAGEHRWTLFCLELASGKRLWEKVLHQAQPALAIHAKNSYASETPAVNADGIVAYFAAAGVFGCDWNGRERWSHKWTPLPLNHGWGPAASPILYKDRAYLVCDNEVSSFMLALDQRTGKQIWRVARPEKSNWSTPLIWKNTQRTELITAGSGKVRSYDLAGRPLWELGGMSTVTIPTPVATPERLYVASGYVTERFRPLYCVLPGAAGDITLAGDATHSRHVAWCLPTGAPYVPSPLIYHERLYVLYDRGALACYDARMGQEIYGRQRLSPEMAAFSASPWAADDKIYCLSEDAETFVVQAGAEFKLLARNPLDDTALASPAIVGNDLLIRTLSKVYRIGARK